MKRLLYKIGMVAAAGVLFSSCSFLDMEPTVMNPEGFYTTEAEVKYGLAGVYGVMSREAFYGQDYSVKLSNADDLCYQNRNSAEAAPEYFNIGSGDETVYKVWTVMYEGIKNANAFMDAIKDSPLDKKHISYAEAKFLRAYYHFLLAQAWGDVPLKTFNIKQPNQADIKATKQVEVLKWSAAEMEECANNYFLADSVKLTPSRVTLGVVEGVLARVYLFMAGASVTGVDKTEMFTKSAYWSGRVIARGNYMINPDYTMVFINMITDSYDTQYRESMWEAEFKGDRSNPKEWTNGRIGDALGLQSQSNATNFEEWACNYSYATFNGSLKLWYLYWNEDLTPDESSKVNRIIDVRSKWNLPVYNYAGNEKLGLLASMHKTPYSGKDLANLDSNTFIDSTIVGGMRNSGKWRRETIYEKQMKAKNLYTTINFPLLRFSDVLLMRAEALNELNGPTQEIYDYIKLVRDRAGVKTRPIGEYDQATFREFIRNERGRELAFEGLRKYDLIRWGKFVDEIKRYQSFVSDPRWGAATATPSSSAVMIGNNVKAKHVYLPIPSKELSSNKLIKQHPLW